MDIFPSFAHLNALGTTLLKGGNGFLGSVTINTKGLTANTLTLYNTTNTAAPVNPIAVIDTTASVVSLDYKGLRFGNGLVAVLAAGTAADVTITWD